MVKFVQELKVFPVDIKKEQANYISKYETHNLTVSEIRPKE